MHTFLDPAILFFILGVAAGLLRSNLEIPPPISKFLSQYLLMALGMKAGFELAHTGLAADILPSLGAALAMAFLVPALGYQLLRRKVPALDAAAVAAAYGSVSAVTFVAAMQHLEARAIPAGGHMAVALVLMESPAIIMAVCLANLVRGGKSAGVVMAGGGTAALLPGPAPGSLSPAKILRESFTDGSHLLLLGSLAVGWVSGEAGQAVMAPFSTQLFKGMLAFFLLDMGLAVARNFGGLRGRSGWLIGYGAIAPFAHAATALLLAALLGLPRGDAALLMVLSASASYIVVPAVLRHAIPEANPSLYCGLSLGITFPLNILVGIPLYVEAANRLLR